MASRSKCGCVWVLRVCVCGPTTKWLLAGFAEELRSVDEGGKVLSHFVLRL